MPLLCPGALEELSPARSWPEVFWQKSDSKPMELQVALRLRLELGLVLGLGLGLELLD